MGNSSESSVNTPQMGRWLFKLLCAQIYECFKFEIDTKRGGTARAERKYSNVIELSEPVLDTVYNVRTNIYVFVCYCIRYAI